MEQIRKMSIASDAANEDHCPALEDSCSTEDDVCSLCSWTTDQGDFDVSDTSSIANHDNAFAASPYQCAVDAYPGGECFGYVPVIVPVCYMPCIVPAMENTMSWPDASIMHVSGQRDRRWNQWESKSYNTRQHSKAVKGSSLAPRTKTTVALSSSQPEPEATTVILRNLPTECTRDVLLQMLDNEGFSGAYDFLHLPIDFMTKTALGYALMNLVNHDKAVQLQQHFQGFTKWPCQSENVCEVAWNNPQQGLAAHIDRYRNSPLMHSSVPETYRPVLLQNGARVPFPLPTMKIRAPRIRHPKPSF